MYSSHRIDRHSQMATNCGSLLSELRKIWDEVGEVDNERDKMLSELEQECLDAYRRKVDHANRFRAQLRQAVADAEAQMADICSALGDRPAHVMKGSGSLKKELQAIMPQLEDMKKKKNERKSQFAEVLRQINSISNELSGYKDENLNKMVIDENDLSMKRLDDLRNQLLILQKEKGERLKYVHDQLNVLNGLCVVLGMDFKLTVCGVHPSLDDSRGTKSISKNTIERLSGTICKLKDVKLQRMQKLQDLAMAMAELWNLMDTPVEEQQMFQNVTRTLALEENEITEANSLSLEFINNAEGEVMRLQEMKASKIKEVLMKKKLILEEICRGAHIVVGGNLGMDLSVESIESGATSPSDLLEQLEVQISKVQDEAFSRKEILEKVQKWLAACEEECWLEEYNRDDNRYNAGRGTHLMLKRAEKARLLVNKIPAMVDTLRSKAKAWEKERKIEFLYDGVGLTSMVDQYCELKHLKEQERQKQRNQKKLQGQLMAEQEAIYGSKPSPTKSGSKNYRPSTGGGGGGGAANKRFSLGGAALQNTLMKNNNPLKRQTSNIHHHQSGFLAHSSGKKNTSVGPMKHHSTNASNNTHSNGPSALRKALSPISLLCSNIISCNFEDQNANINEFKDPHTACRTPTKMPVPTPATPPTVSNAMQTTTTPFTPGLHGNEEVVDYSYEERRAGFDIMPKSFSKPLF